MFTKSDLQIIEQQGNNLEKVNWQIEQFKKGIKPIVLERVATTSDGIIQIKNSTKYIDIYDKAKLKITKFVPASGAASRMFKSLFEYIENKHIEKAAISKDVKEFCDNIEKFAFYQELNNTLEAIGGIKKLFAEKKYSVVIEKLLNSKGLSYGQLPKGLLKFHIYNGNKARTPFEEHLVEGALYACSKNRMVNVHFTVSPEHMNSFNELYIDVINHYEKMYDVKYNVEFSVQKSSTNTIAVKPDNTPFYNADGTLLFRPGGHGALIENLNEIDSDIIFIKNIDNVVKENKLKPTIEYKKVLAGKLLELQNTIFQLIDGLIQNPTEEITKKAADFIKDELFIEDKTKETNVLKKAELLIERLNRPIRVCGVVKNQGEPGGGPFYVRDSKNCISLQIVESSQVDSSDKNQTAILDSATHFNPVDLVCATKDYSGKKFDLRKYVDNEACFISKKSMAGKELKALELPGLWNGAMSFWNTVFVEVPVDTFNPVKTVNDLLRESHQ